MKLEVTRGLVALTLAATVVVLLSIKVVLPGVLVHYPGLKWKEPRYVPLPPPVPNTGSQPLTLVDLGNSTNSSEVPTATANTTSKLTQLHWTSLHGKAQKKSYHFFSAYYDNRLSVPGRPVVLVLGYVDRKVPTLKFYCALRLPNGTRLCLAHKPAVSKHPSSCFRPGLPAKPFHYHCPVLPELSPEPPVSVQLSTDPECAAGSLTSEIPVGNRRPKDDIATKPKKMFGVCVGSPLVRSPTLLQDLKQFVEMSLLLGAELIVFYVNETQVDKNVLEYLWTQHPESVLTVGWRKFEKWKPLHYYGQVLLVSDCHHRTMYEVDYMATIDIDEVILPVKHKRWSDMIKASGKNNAMVFKFQNRFFKRDGSSTGEIMKNCSTPMRVPKYFTHTTQLKCFWGFGYRTKLIVQPRFVVEHSFHYVCKSVPGHTLKYNVPPELGILGHYRPTIPDDCKTKPTLVDHVAWRFWEELVKRMCSREM